MEVFAVATSYLGNRRSGLCIFSQPPIRKTGVSLQKSPCPLAVPVGTELSGFCLREEKAGP